MTFAVTGAEGRTFAVVTSFSPRGYDVYGRPMLRTFAEWWPDDVDLYVYYEGERPADASNRAEWVSLDKDADRSRFMAKFSDPVGPIWDYTKGIVKYSHKVWAMTAAPRKTDVLIWLDGDITTTQPVTRDWLDRVCPAGYIGSYLARPYRHTETGFLSFNLAERGGQFLGDFRRVYKFGDIAKLPEHHDCAAYDFMRAMYEESGFQFFNLCPGATGLGVFEQSALHPVLAHHKGPSGKAKAYGVGDMELV